MQEKNKNVFYECEYFQILCQKKVTKSVLLAGPGYYVLYLIVVAHLQVTRGFEVCLKKIKKSRNILQGILIERVSKSFLYYLMHSRLLDFRSFLICLKICKR